MYSCPECRTKLKHQMNAHSYWGCTTCKGHLVGFGTLKTLISASESQKLWQESAHVNKTGRPCAGCAQPLRPVNTKGEVEIDVCRSCYLVWLDHGEKDSLHQNSDIIEGIKSKATLSKEEQAAYLQALTQTREHTDTPLIEKVDRSDVELWHWAPAIFGLPIEVSQRGPKRIHWTWILTILAVMAFCMFHLEQHYQKFGFISAEPFRHYGWTWISSFFLHGNFLHILGNAYFFLIFADDVEDDLTTLEFFILVFGSHFAGVLAHWAIGGTSDIPLVGMSAGVFGVLGYYMMRFPRTRIRYMFLFFFRPIWWQTSAKWLVVFKVITEIIATYMTTKQLGGVAHAAHVAGAVVGIGMGYIINSSREDIKPKSI